MKKQKKDYDQRIIDILNGEIKPVTDEEIRILKQAKKDQKDGYITEIPLD